MLVLDVDLKRITVLVKFFTIRAIYGLLSTGMHILHVSPIVSGRNVLITSLAVGLTCNITAHVRICRYCAALGGASDMRNYS